MVHMNAMAMTIGHTTSGLITIGYMFVLLLFPSLRGRCDVIFGSLRIELTDSLSDPLSLSEVLVVVH